MNETYDWMDLVVSNPEKSYADFALAGIGEESIKLQDEDHYKENDKIQQMFSGDDGQFDEEAYHKFYSNVAKSYSDYVKDDAAYKAFAEDFDIDDLREKNRLKGDVYLRKVPNPLLQTTGLEGVFATSEPKRSVREAMQDNYVRDWRTGKSLGWKPNDDDKRGLLDFLGTPAVVEARWEEDGTHKDPFTGQTVEHKKGDYKTDGDGNYYYETLGGRDASGKEFLHYYDTLTVDGTFWNKFDPFDSDGVSKSVGGQVMKTAAMLAPLLIPGVSTAYGYVMAGMLLTDALASFGKAGAEALTEDYKANPLWNAFNAYGAFMRRFDNTSSDENGYFEQGANMLGTVASQLFQQRAIAQIPRYLHWDKKEAAVIRDFVDKHGVKYMQRYGKSIQQALADGDITATSLLSEQKMVDAYNRTMRMGKKAADASKLYMVATQTQGVYDAFKEAGFDAGTTAIGVLGTAVGFHKLFDTSLGEVALSGLGLDEIGQATRPVTKKLAEGFKESLSKLAPVTTEEGKRASRNAILRYGDKFCKSFKETLANSGLGPDMLKESLEEVSEEGLQDIMLAGGTVLNEALNSLGYTNKRNTYDFGKTNPLERYFMAAFGGATGAAVFRGINRWHDFLNGNHAVSQLPKDDLRNLIKILSENPASAVKDYVNRQEYASKTLSTEVATAPDGSSYFKRAERYEDSQDAIIKNTLLGIIDSIDSSIKAEIGSVDKENILNSALGRDIRARELAGNSYETLQKIADDFNNIVADLVQAKAKLSSVKDGEQPGKADQEAYDAAKKNYEGLMAGERAADYVERMAFLLNRDTAGVFKKNLDIYTFAMSRGKNYSVMPPDEKEKLEMQFKAAVDSDLHKEDTAFKAFKFFRDKVQGEMQAIADDDEGVKTRKAYQDALTEIEEELVKEYVSEEKTDEYKKGLEAQRDAGIDKFIRDNKLDPSGKLETDEDKKFAADFFIGQKVYSWQMEQLAKIRIEPGNMDMGADPALVSLPGKLLMRFKELLDGVARGEGQDVDFEVMEKMRKIFGHFNKFDFNTLVPSVLEAVKAHLDGGGTVTAAIENSSVLPEKDGNTSGMVEITKSGNGYHAYNMDTGDEYDVELSDNDWKDIINGHFTAGLSGGGDSGKMIGGLFPEAGKTGGFAVQPGFTGSDGKPMKGALQSFISDAIGNAFSGDNAMASQLRDLRELEASMDAAAAKTVTESGLRRLLSRLSKELTGEDVFNIFNEEDKVFGQLSSLSDYVLRNKVTEAQLRGALAAITMAKAVVNYSLGNNEGEFGSMIDIVNHARQKQALPPIPVIDEEKARFLMHDLDRLANRISFLLDLSMGNTVSKMKESTLAMARTESLLIYAFANTDDNESWFGGKLGFFDYDMTPHAEFFAAQAKEGFSRAADDVEVLARIDQVFTDMMDHYRKKFAALTPDEQDILLSKIAQGRDASDPHGLDYMSNMETVISRNTTKDDLSPEFIGNFCVAMLAVNQKDVKKRFLDAMEGSGYAPFFGQYLDIAMSMAFAENTPMINRFIELKKELNPSLGNVHFFNIIVNNGDPGAGKTTSVAYYIARMLRAADKDAVIMPCAPQEDQARRLAASMGEANSYGKAQLFDRLLTPEGKKYYEAAMASLQAQDGKYGDGNKLMVEPPANCFQAAGAGHPIHIFIDEHTHFHAYEMDLLSKMPNVKVFAFGDTKQMGVTVGNTDNDISGIVFSSPPLIMSVRAGNGHKQDNLTVISSILRTVGNELNRSRLNRTIYSSRGKYKLLAEDTYLKYYQDGTLLQGDKTAEAVTREEMEGLIKGLGDGEYIALVTDKASSPTRAIFEALKEEYPDKVLIKDASSVQGSEYKYVVVDVTYPKVYGNTDDDFNDNFLQALKALNTHMTRSSQGTIIITKDNQVPVAGSTRMSYTSDSSLKKEDIDNYKALISGIFKKSLGMSGEGAKAAGGPVPQTMAPSATKADDVNDAREKALEDEQKKDEDDAFQGGHAPIYFYSSHVGLSLANGEFTPVAGSNEDLNIVMQGKAAMTREQVMSSDGYKAWSYLKRFAYMTKAEKDDFIKRMREDTMVASMFRPFMDAMGIAGIDDFIKVLGNASMQLKVSRMEKTRDYQFNQTGYERKSKNFARVVMRLETGGKAYDITVADLPEASNIRNGKLKAFVEADYAVPAYAAIGNWDKLEQRGFGRMAEENPSGITLEEHGAMFPELSFSKVYYENAPGKSKNGVPYVIVSDRPGMTDKELREKFLDPSETHGVAKMYLSAIPYTYDEFFEKLDNLIAGRHNGKEAIFQLRHFVPKMLASRWIDALYGLRDALEDVDGYNKKVDEYNEKAREENARNAALGGKMRKRERRRIEASEADELRRQVNSAFGWLAELMPIGTNRTVSGVTYRSLADFKAAWDNMKAKTANDKFDDIKVPDFTEPELKFLDKFPNMKLETLFRNIAEGKDPSITAKAGTLLEGFDKLKEKAVVMTRMFNILGSEFTGKTFQEMKGWFNNGVLFSTLKDFQLIFFFADKSKMPRDLLLRAMETVDHFNYGVISMGRPSADYMEDFIPSNLGHDQVYMYKPVSPRMAYLPVDGLRLEQDAAKPASPAASKPADEIYQSIRKEMEGNIGDTMKQPFGSMMGQFEKTIDKSWTEQELKDKLKRFLINNHKKYRTLSWDGGKPFLFSFKYENGVLETARDEITKDRLVKDGCKIDTAGNDINFEEIDGNICFRSSNANKMKRVVLNKNTGKLKVENFNGNAAPASAPASAPSQAASSPRMIGEKELVDFYEKNGRLFAKPLNNAKNIAEKMNAKNSMKEKVEELVDYITKDNDKIKPAMLPFISGTIETWLKNDNITPC